MSNMRHGGMGRKKVEIKKIENKNYLQTTFSKRRNGLFSKASDLRVLFGAEFAIIVFSPNGRPYVFGYPSADAVIDRFLNGGSTPYEDEDADQDENDEDEYEYEYKYVCGDGHINQNQQPSPKRANKREKDVVESSGARGGGGDGEGFWWDTSIENMDLNELGTFKAAMEELMEKVAEMRGCNDSEVTLDFTFYGERICRS